MNQNESTYPPYINDKYGTIFFADTEPLEQSPNSQWNHTVNVTVAISRKPNDSGTFSVAANGSSEYSNGFEKIEFNQNTNMLTVTLNALPAPGIRENFMFPDDFEFTPSVSGDLNIEVVKKGKKVGRQKHTIAYSNIRE